MIPALKAANKRFRTPERVVDALIATDMKGENFLNILSTPERFADDIAKFPDDFDSTEYFYNLTMDVIGNPTAPEARALVRKVVERKTITPARIVTGKLCNIISKSFRC